MFIEVYDPGLSIGKAVFAGGGQIAGVTLRTVTFTPGMPHTYLPGLGDISVGDFELVVEKPQGAGDIYTATFVAGYLVGAARALGLPENRVFLPLPAERRRYMHQANVIAERARKAHGGHASDHSIDALAHLLNHLERRHNEYYAQLITLRDINIHILS